MAISKVVQDSLNGGVAGTGPAFSAYLTSNQTMSASTWTKVTLDSEEFDTNSNFASYKFTPTVAGYYQISAVVQLDSTSTCAAPLGIAIYKNGAGYKYNTSYIPTGGSGASTNISCVLYLNGSTDYVELYGIQGAGLGTLRFNAGATTTSLSGSMVRGA